jgi:hypothetical protein
LLQINLNLFCKINDQNAENSDHSLSENSPLPQTLIDKAEKILSSQISELVETSVQTGCDFLRIKEKLYRYNHKQYSRFENNILDALKPQITVKVSGQK